MANKINNDFVGIHPDDGGTWWFIVPSKIGCISEQIDRFDAVVRKLFAACEGFIQPIEIEYSVRTYSADGPIEAIDPMNDTDDVEFLSADRKTIADEGGLTADDVPFASYTDQNDTIHYIGDFEMTRVQVRLTLDGYEGWIDRTDDQYVKPARFDTEDERRANHDPIGIRLDHDVEQSAEVNSTVGIEIASPTDIWFEETPIGQANQQRLRTVFERLTDQFDIIDTMVMSRGKNKKMRELLPE